MNDKPFKSKDQFIYLGSNISSTESDVIINRVKACNAVDRLSIIWKSDLTGKIKRDFFYAVAVSILLYGCTTGTLRKRIEKKLDGTYPRSCLLFLINHGSNTLQNTSYTANYNPSHKLFKTNKTCLALLEKQG